MNRPLMLFWLIGFLAFTVACVGAATLTYPDDFPDKGIAQTLEDIPDGTVGDPTVLEIRSDDYDLTKFVNLRGKKHITVRGIDGRPTLHVKTKGSGGNEVFLPAGCEGVRLENLRIEVEASGVRNLFEGAKGLTLYRVDMLNEADAKTAVQRGAAIEDCNIEGFEHAIWPPPVDLFGPFDGVVFADANANGTQDPGEKGISGVQVNHGPDITFTDSRGRYELPQGPRDFVFITRPSGYRPTGPFYYFLAEQDQQRSRYDFALVKDPDAPVDDVTFVQMSDTHCYIDDAWTENWRMLVEELNALETDTAFIMDTGDVVDPTRNNAPEYALFTQEIVGFKTPFLMVPGNHDPDHSNKEDRWSNYKKYCGVMDYSFDFGAYHFIAVNDYMFSDEAFATWLKKDLEINQDKYVIFFLHHPMAGRIKGEFDNIVGIDRYPKIIAAFAGHWHATHRFMYKGVSFIETQSVPWGGGDGTPAGYRIVFLEDGKVTTKIRYAGVKEHMAIVFPDAATPVEPGRVRILVNVYDSSAELAKVAYSVDGGEESLMAPVGDWSWVATTPVAPEQGQHSLEVRATSKGGRSWKRKSAFRVAGKEYAAPQTRSEWPCFQGNVRHTGIAEDKVTAPLRLAWFHNTGGLLRVGSPVVADGMVFAGVDDSANNRESGVVAVNAATGKRLWKVAADSPVKATPALGSGRVVFISYLGTVYCVESRTGDIAWKYNLGDGTEPLGGRSPIVVDGVAYVGAINGPLTPIAGPTFIAVELSSGKIKWKTSIPDTRDITHHGYLATGYKDGQLYLADSKRGLYVLDASNGEIIWAGKDIIGPSTSTGITIGDKLCFMGNLSGTVFAVDPTARKRQWKLNLWLGDEYRPLHSTPAWRESTLYIGTHYGTLTALDVQSQEKIWEFYTQPALLNPSHRVPFAQEHGPVLSSPVISGDIIYFGSVDGWFYAVSRTTGKGIWKYEIGSPIMTSAAVSGNTVFVGALDGNLYAFTRQETGRLQ
jgi:outer membrane protein assembly factor BamB